MNYRIRKNSLQSNYLRNFYWIWKINKDYNKLNIIENLTSYVYLDQFFLWGKKYILILVFNIKQI